MPVIGMPSGRNTAPFVVPMNPALGTIVGSTARGTLNIVSISSSQASFARSISRVREALVTSVACTAPLVRRCTRNVSMVPKASSPFSARARAPFSWSRIHAIFVPEKYASITRPVRSRTSASAPVAFRRSHSAAVRRSCHTMALKMGLPDARSQSSVVSRWLVMPMAAMSAASMPASAMAPPTDAPTLVQICSGSCSTHPGCGKCWANSTLFLPSVSPSRVTTMAVEPVVP